MLEKLTTEQRNAASERIDTLPTLEMLGVINRADQQVALAVEAELPHIAKAVDGTVEAVRAGGRLFYIGAGTSGRLGVLDASECPPTFNAPPELVQGIMAGGEAALARAAEANEDDPEAGASDLMARGFTGKDVLCGIAASGRTPYVLGAIAKARELGAFTIGLSCVAGSTLSKAAEVGITPVTGPEILTGSTRMKAGTATKLVLNMLSTGLMIRLGMTYGNLMVNVQPKNVKLVDRAERIIADGAGVSREEAARLLEESGRSVRTAIVMARLGLGRAEAEAKLQACGNVVARALGENR
ncbi:MAG: N-acetylmuramic acid 6-phosphate etherase [Acidobacteria bacterium]|nr:N-acetylmuramic acid 6-phosphate etherase [Acidobacteriota bacterium]